MRLIGKKQLEKLKRKNKGNTSLVLEINNLIDRGYLRDASNYSLPYRRYITRPEGVIAAWSVADNDPCIDCDHDKFKELLVNAKYIESLYGVK